MQILTRRGSWSRSALFAYVQRSLFAWRWPYILNFKNMILKREFQCVFKLTNGMLEIQNLTMLEINAWNQCQSMEGGTLTLYVPETKIMLLQTDWIQASHQVAGRLAWDPACLPLSLSFPRFKRIYTADNTLDLFLEIYQHSKGSTDNGFCRI